MSFLVCHLRRRTFQPLGMADANVIASDLCLLRGMADCGCEMIARKGYAWHTIPVLASGF